VREDNAIIRVVLVDDDVFARLALKDQIDAQPDIRVVGTASNCEEAIDVLRSTNARVVIAEARLPGSGCMDLLDKLRSEGVAVGLLVLTRSERGGDVLRLVQAGATAHLRKSVSSSELAAAVRAVATGGRVLDQQAFDAVLRDYRIRCGRRSGGQASTLTPREQQVLTLVAEGCSTREIAARLELSSKTIESHRPRLMEKLGARRMADLVRHALREGLVGVG
jgi:DNA-binding NarL/FixJ family response regulator